MILSDSAPPVLHLAPRHFTTRLALLFSGPLLVNGFAMPFFPIWLATLHMSDPEIALILAVPMFLRVFTAPLAGVLADRMGERTRLLHVSAVLSLLTALALFVSDSFWFILVVYTLQGGVYSPYVPIVEAIALSGVRRWGFDYARMRLWGSIVFIVATMIGGELISLVGGSMVLPAMALSFAVMIGITFLAPKVGPPRRPSTLTSLAAPQPKALRRRDVQTLILGVGLVNGSHGMLFAFSALYWSKIGFTGTEIGLLWSAGVLAEIAMFVVAKPLLLRMSLWVMILSGAALAVGRWLLFPLDLGFGGYLALQTMHAFTYALMHTGLQNQLVRQVPEEQEAGAQGLYFFYTGLSTAVCTFISGYAYAWYGASGFYAMSAVAALGVSLIVAAWTMQRGPAMTRRAA
ncbi:MFS transporter [Rhizobium sp. CC-YZS058]|uniref:MFS transporter n=1 Tax=Rhizobium sp. CC-YZS058 TaxID=3042153 RepID=UPI002B058B11|nr:MFS transporter [Rhizobium sp. CC-YZS058]MEA3535020.1 MFS transporter [Rhizobium sp. CC-YZS058]